MSISHHGGDCILRASESEQCRHGEKPGVHFLFILFGLRFDFLLLLVSPLLRQKRTERLRIRFRIPARQSTSRRCLKGNGTATEHRATVVLHHRGGREAEGRHVTAKGSWKKRISTNTTRSSGLAIHSIGGGSRVGRSIQQGARHCFSEGSQGREDEGREESCLVSLPSPAWPGDTGLQKTTKNQGQGAADMDTVFFDFFVVFTPDTPRRRHGHRLCHS